MCKCKSDECCCCKRQREKDEYWNDFLEGTETPIAIMFGIATIAMGAVSIWGLFFNR